MVNITRNNQYYQIHTSLPDSDEIVNICPMMIFMAKLLQESKTHLVVSHLPILTLCNVNSTLYYVNPTLCNVNATLFYVNPTLCNVNATLYCVNPTLYYVNLLC